MPGNTKETLPQRSPQIVLHILTRAERQDVKSQPSVG